MLQHPASIHSILDSAFGVPGALASHAAPRTVVVVANEEDNQSWAKDLSVVAKQPGCVWAAELTSSWAASCKASLATIRQRPCRTLLAPALVLLVCLGLGIFAVLAQSKDAEGDLRAHAKEFAFEAITSLKQLMIGLVSPVAVVSTYVRANPSCQDMNGTFQGLAHDAVQWAPNVSAIMQLQLLPAGVLTMVYPLNSADRVMGLDLFAHPRRRADVLRVAAGGIMTIEGPYHLLEGGFAAVVYNPIYVALPDLPASGGVNSTAAGSPGCSRAPTNCTTCGIRAGKGGGQEAFWGFASALVDMEPLTQGGDTAVGALRDKQYLYRLWRPATAVNSDIPITSSPQLPRNPVCVYLDVYNATWVLEVSPAAGWVPAWRAGAIAAVVTASAVLSVLLLLLLVAKEQHKALLQEMLPKRAIEWLEQGRGAFVDTFEMTTILFTDCVQYTDMSSALSPLDVVTILNELYEEFDALTNKHDVYKVETIGDAFMCVAGCPQPLAGPSGAVRMAAMALDMVDVVERFMSSNGHRIQIRVGMHSGPVVAGVIGKRMPRFALFGDTVNTASRCESNSQAMRIHISAATAGLLSQAAVEVAPGSYPWQLQSRGTIVVKGKGLMDTYWLVKRGCPVLLTAPDAAAEVSAPVTPLQPSADFSGFLNFAPAKPSPEANAAEDDAQPALMDALPFAAAIKNTTTLGSSAAACAAAPDSRRLRLTSSLGLRIASAPAAYIGLAAIRTPAERYGRGQLLSPPRQLAPTWQGMQQQQQQVEPVSASGNDERGSCRSSSFNSSGMLDHMVVGSQPQLLFGAVPGKAACSVEGAQDPLHCASCRVMADMDQATDMRGSQHAPEPQMWASDATTTMAGAAWQQQQQQQQPHEAATGVAAVLLHQGSLPRNMGGLSRFASEQQLMLPMLPRGDLGTGPDGAALGAAT